MYVIVIDNCDWVAYHHAGMSPQPVYCASTADKSPEELYEELRELCWKEYGSNEDIYYLINIHCIFKNPKEPKPKEYLLQDQIGVLLYRQLLKIYEKSPRKLKVGFFSPVSKEELISRKPENYIISLFPFFETPFTWDECCKKLHEWNPYPVFNTSSENLLAGYKIYCSEESTGLNMQVASGIKKVVLFIDDQANEWETTFKELFKDGTINKMPYKNQQEFRSNFLNRQNTDFTKKLEKELEDCKLVLSDFYLVEDHDPAKWMDKNQIANISGFQLFNDIKNIDKGVPVVMHTSSSKIPYYKVFDYFGVDDWIVKDLRVNATPSEKRDNYILFKETIQCILENDTYQKLRIYWNEILKVDSIKTTKWWYNPSAVFIESKYGGTIRVKKKTFGPLNENEKDLAISILKSSWYAIRRMLNREIAFEEQKVDEKNIFKKDHFTAAAVCNNLGKIIQLLGIKSGSRRFSLLTNFLLLIRNSASHENDYELFEVNDALIFMDYILTGLNNNAVTGEDLNIIYPDKFIKKGSGSEQEDEFPFALFWVYLQFYNSECSKQCIIGRNMIHNRLVKLFRIANEAKAIGPVLTKNTDFFSEYTYPKKGITDYESDYGKNLFKIKVPVV